METEFKRIIYIGIFLLIVPSLLTVCNCTRGNFSDVRNICRNNSGVLVSPVNIPPNQRKNFTLWTGSYVTVSDWISYKGCYLLKNERDHSYIYLLKHNSPEKCQVYCRCNKLFGLQGKACICLNSERRLTSQRRSQCNSLCNGSVEQKCGSENLVSVYEGLKFQNDDSKDDQNCLSMKCLDNSIDSIKLRSHNCSIRRQFLCYSEDNQIQMTQTVRNLTWSNSAKRCYEQNSVLETYVNKNACENSYIHTETWIGIFRNKVSINYKDPYHDPILSCQVMGVNTSRTYDLNYLNSLSEQTQNCFICEEKHTQRSSEHQSCGFDPYPAHIFADTDESSVQKDTFFTNSAIFSEYSTVGSKILYSKEDSSFSTPVMQYNKDSTLVNTVSTKENRVTHANNVVSILPIQETQSKLAIFNIDTSTVPSSHQTHYVQTYKTAQSNISMGSHQEPTTDKTVIIAGISSGIVILLVTIVLVIIWIRGKRRATCKQEGNQAPSVKVNDMYDLQVTSNMPRNKESKKNEEHSYVNVNTESSTGDKSFSKPTSQMELQHKRINTDFSVYGYQNEKSGQNHKSRQAQTEENKYDNFVPRGRNVVTDDVYDHTHINQDQCDYDQLHAKNVNQNDDDFYSHTRDIIDRDEYDTFQKHKFSSDVYDKT